MAQSERSSGIVLIVEDDDALRTSLRDALVAEDVRAMSVADLGAARRAIAEVDFDVVLLDLMLSGESGADLLEELSLRPSSPPVVVVSALSTAGATAKSYGVPLLGKPFDLDQLLGAIDEAIRTSARPRSALQRG